MIRLKTHDPTWRPGHVVPDLFTGSMLQTIQWTLQGACFNKDTVIGAGEGIFARDDSIEHCYSRCRSPFPIRKTLVNLNRIVINCLLMMVTV